MNKVSQNFLILLLCLATAISATGQGKSPYNRITFADEFEGKYAAPADQDKWTAEVGGKGWGNQELQYYTASTDNAFHDGKGNLVIKVIKLQPPLGLECWYGPCQYTSARLITKGKFEQKYGRFEARIKVPRGQGMWPAFWMLGNDIDSVGWPACGEIDIMEYIGREPRTSYGTIHGPGHSGANGIGTPFKMKMDVADDFHTFATEWGENKIEFFVDGKRFRTLTPKDLPPGAKWVYDHPFYMLLNFAVGGPWGGNPDATTTLPQEMLVDYVRVYQ
jgi:beta-glucanase (GH16 family)